MSQEVLAKLESKAEAPATREKEEALEKGKKAKVEKAPKEKKPLPEDEAPGDVGRLDLCEEAP